MPDDPVSTVSQREQELAALELIEHPTIKAAYRTLGLDEKFIRRLLARLHEQYCCDA